MFSQTTEYALRAMAWLALSPEELVSATSLAEHTKVPEHYLAKVLQQLGATKPPLVTGRRGVGGGYKLARPSSEISLLSVINAVSTVDRIHTCPLGLASHGTNLCPLHRRMDRAAAQIIEIFDGVSLQDLLTEQGASTPLCEPETKARVTVSARRP